MLLYVVVHVVDKTNVIVDMAWSVGLQHGGGVFKPCLKYKG